MRILGIDPGISTGIVLWDSETGIIAHATIVGKDPIDFIRKLLVSDTTVVIEDVPLFGASKQSQRYGSIISDLVPEHRVHSIMPAEWKPIAKIRKWNASFLSTKHESDAYCLTQYYWYFKVQK